jgi:hypothetical protein
VNGGRGFVVSAIRFVPNPEPIGISTNPSLKTDTLLTALDIYIHGHSMWNNLNKDQDLQSAPI